MNSGRNHAFVGSLAAWHPFFLSVGRVSTVVGMFLVHFFFFFLLFFFLVVLALFRLSWGLQKPACVFASPYQGCFLKPWPSMPRASRGPLVRKAQAQMCTQEGYRHTPVGLVVPGVPVTFFSFSVFSRGVPSYPLKVNLPTKSQAFSGLSCKLYALCVGRFLSVIIVHFS